MNYIFNTIAFLEKISSEPKKDIILNKIQELLKIPNPENFNSVDKFPKGLLVIKFSKTLLCRIIVQPMTLEISEKIGEQKVFFVRQFFGGSNFDYVWGNVTFPQLRSGEWIKKNPISQEELDRAKSDFMAQSLVEVEQPIPPPQNVLSWINDFQMTLEFHIYEHESWVNYANDPINGLLDKYILFFKRILKTLVNKTRRPNIIISRIEEEHNLFSIIDSDEKLGIIYQEFSDLDDKRILFLHNGAHLDKQNEHWEKALEQAKETIVDSNLTSISKEAFRAYPNWIINSGEEELWEYIQRHDGAHNFSLLPEQVDFLTQFKFPAYINGQAGSGKSTMLYYLFANVYLHKLLNELEGKIIFLTENDNLLDQTSQSVLGLLSSNPEFNTGLSIEQKSDVRQYFISFKDYLIETLPEKDRLYFSDQKYLDFARFKELFNQRIPKSKFSAEEVWFVITTYVYGYYEDRVIDSVEKYRDETSGIPRNFRIVSDEHFEEISSNDLNFYNKLVNNEGYWDKTTLVRKIRTYYPRELPNHYAVVFCDEAQDFSRIELRLIIHSSTFLKYDLSNIDQIPIVFAGDALQTVSPNGYSVRRLHQMYYDVFKEAQFNYEKGRSTYNPTFNYRSVDTIVRLANIIQNYRKESLKEDVFIKQEAKRIDSFNRPPLLHDKFWLTQEAVFESFQEKFKYKSFIVPIDLHEESNYVVSQPILKNFDDVKSSIDSKGAEYSQVVVYGFGEFYLQEFGSLTWGDNSYDFKTKFFFNKLYVAITRAQNELILIDSSDAIEKFWKPLLDIPDSIPDPWEKFDDRSDILLIKPESGLDNVLASSPEMAFENAQKDMEQGLLDKNVARLKVASSIFLTLGENSKANLCLGHAEQVKENWGNAADFYGKAGNDELQAESYFKGKYWNRLEDTSKLVSGTKNQVRLLISQLMINKEWDRSSINKAYDLRSDFHSVLRDVTWYDEYGQTLNSFAENTENSEIKRQLTSFLRSVLRQNDYKLKRTLGNLNFSIKQFSEAIEVWDELLYGEPGIEIFNDYISARIEKAKDESNEFEELLWTGKLMLTQVESASNISLAKKLLSIVDNVNINDVDNDELKCELESHQYAAKSILGDIIGIRIHACDFESSQFYDGNVCEFYESLIRRSDSEAVSIFLKERWAKNKLRELRSRLSSDDDDEILKILNKEFDELAFPFDESNQDWTIAEIDEISTDPKDSNPNPNSHIKNIVIENFRRFDRLELKNLGQFNLLLGGNNTGKTSILEALIFDEEPNACALNYLYANNQRMHYSVTESSTNFFDNLISHSSTKNSIIFTLKNGRHLSTFILRHPTSRELFESLDMPEVDPNSLDVNNYLCIVSNNINKNLSDSFEILAKDLTEPKTLSKVPFIPFGKGYSEKLSSIYFSEIGNNRTLRKSFTEQMKLFIPNIVEITIDPSDGTIKIEEVDKNGMETALPLHDYGEGANKLFRILVQLHASKGKRLTIDEIDAGIHYSHFKEFWEIILKSADQYNVQVFATTHNEECVDFFYQALLEEELSNLRFKSRTITLESHLDSEEMVPIVRDFNSITYANDNNLEVRGRGK